MRTKKYYIINGGNEAEHTKATFGVLVIDSDEKIDLEAKNILDTITVIKENAFDKNAYPANTPIVIVECLQSQIKRETSKTITLRWGGNIAHITTAGEYDPKHRQWRRKFWDALHNRQEIDEDEEKESESQSEI